ncbi:MAG: LTA synthase family protein [Lachnospiraceae bacterium]|nr:LTA synthase family protein [Lachnospiraceae bacterium]
MKRKEQRKDTERKVVSMSAYKRHKADAAEKTAKNPDAAEPKEKKRTGKKLFTVLFVVFTFISLLVALSARWAFTTWSNLKMEEIIFELTQPLTGTGNNMIEEYMVRALVPAIVAAAALIFILFFLRKRTWYKRMTVIGFIATMVFAFFTGRYCWEELKIGDWLANRGKSSTYIEDNYVNPATTELTFPEKKRNLIYIYLESMEKTYADKENGGGFEENCIPELTQLAQENEDFGGTSTKLNGGYALSGTTWTVGAMFGQTSGLPLKIQIDTNGMGSQTTFFPGITTLGDILRAQGYTQDLLIGSNASFGGRDTYFTEHGNYNLLDYKYAQENGLIPLGYKVWWGYEDEKLFDIAKQRLSYVAGKGTPFNLTMLTVDTHFPDGYVCDLCGNEFGDNQYANVMHCSSKQVSAFVKWCQEQSWYDNTTIVISGDHPTMDADFCDDVDKKYVRKVYTCYINSAVTPADPTKRRKFTTLDDFPTTLAALGVRIDGERLGLGTNLFSDTETLSERDGYNNENTELERNSEWMNKMSGISDAAVAQRNKILSVKKKVKISFTNDDTYMYVTVKGLKSIAPFMEFAYIHIRNDNQLTLTEPKLVPQSDGTYAFMWPLTKLQGNKDITYMLRVRTSNGTVDLTDAIPYTVKD